MNKVRTIVGKHGLTLEQIARMIYDGEEIPKDSLKLTRDLKEIRLAPFILIINRKIKTVSLAIPSKEQEDDKRIKITCERGGSYDPWRGDREVIYPTLEGFREKYLTEEGIQQKEIYVPLPSRAKFPVRTNVPIY